MEGPIFAEAPTSGADAQWVRYGEVDVLAKKGSPQPAHFHPVQFEVLGTLLGVSSVISSNEVGSYEEAASSNEKSPSIQFDKITNKLSSRGVS